MDEAWVLRQLDKMLNYIDDLQAQINYLKYKIAILEETTEDKNNE